MSDDRIDRTSENLPQTVDAQGEPDENLPKTVDDDSATSCTSRTSITTSGRRTRRTVMPRSSSSSLAGSTCLSTA